MNRPTVVGARAIVAAAVVSGFATLLGSGVADAAPQDCAVSRDLFGATATCHDDGPAGREYALIVECFGLHGIPGAFPLMAVGPYGGSWNGSFGPTGQGTASCLGPMSVGTATNAYVKIYRE
ncbi:hypothetical protein [Nocardia nova]|jgi:hypothetical protein|uniref:hypothetical protein n=1 Tax=Nocardia nova TaxID=37330 RepID=UPI0025B19252|nr:hypothetical protein [Nocardia nova]